MSDTDDFLAHYGVKGMRWGKRKAESSSDDKPEKKPMDPEKKQAIKDLVGIAGGISVAIALRKGAQWALNNPDKVASFIQRAEVVRQRAANVRNGTKAIGTGYQVIKIAGGAPGLIPLN